MHSDDCHDRGACFWKLAHLSDEQLIDGLAVMLSACRRSIARLVAHLAEVEERRLHLRVACSSMFSYCTARLGMSEDEACRRIEAARLARRFPAMYSMLDDGRLGLTVLCLLKEHASEENHAQLLAGVSGKSVRDAREWLAGRFPRADVADSIRKLPQRFAGTPVLATAAVTRFVAETDGVATAPAAPPAEGAEPTATTGGLKPLGALASVAIPNDARQGAVAGSVADCAGASVPAGTTGVRPSASTRAARVEPLSEDRYKVQFTASRALRAKLELARDLMSHASGGSDLSAVVERAVDLLVDDLMKKRFGTGAQPRKPRAAAEGRVVQATRRAVVARDGLACTFVDERGRRCGARAWLEVDHAKARARGGGSAQDNVRILCRPHNQLMAELEFGRDHVEHAIALRRRRAASRVPAPARVKSNADGVSGDGTRGSR
jgi:hypothetical protein